jgi:hypothetical protein
MAALAPGSAVSGAGGSTGMLHAAANPAQAAIIVLRMKTS